MYSNWVSTRTRLTDTFRGLFQFNKPKNGVFIDNYYKKIYQEEATLGGGLVSSKDKSTRSEFFCLDESNWLLHEEWIGHDGQKNTQTIRYEIKKDCIYKYLGNGQSYKLDPKEATNLLVMVKRYRQTICNHYYSNNK